MVRKPPNKKGGGMMRGGNQNRGGMMGRRNQNKGGGMMNRRGGGGLMGGAQTAMQAQQMRNMSRGNNNRGGGNRGGGGGNGGDGGGDGGAEEQEELLEGEADEEGGEKKTEMHNDDDDAAIRKSKWHIEEGKFPIQQTKVWLFILDDPQWFIMFIFSQILFWVWAWPIYEEFGYADYVSATLMNVDEHGSIESGPSGSGIFPMGFLLMIAGTTIFFTRLVMYDAQKHNPEIQVLGLDFFFNTGGGDGYDDDEVVVE